MNSVLMGYHYSPEIYECTLEDGGITLISVDLSSKCNYLCDWCTNKHLIGRKDEDKLGLKEYRSILEGAKEKGARTLVVPGTGEPTLDPDFYPLTDLAKALGYVTVVYSNITGNLNEERIKQLFENDVSIVIKLDSLDPTYFEHRYRAPQKNYALFWDNFETIINMYAGSTTIEEISGIAYAVPRVAANMVLNLENVHEVEEIAELCNDRGLAFFCKPVKPGTWAKDSVDVWRTIGNKEGVLKQPEVLVDAARKYTALQSTTSNTVGDCALYRYGLTIKNNGDAQLCPDHHGSRGLFGNVRDSSITQIIGKITDMKKTKSCGCVMDLDISKEL